MSIAVDVHEGGPPVEDLIDGEGWGGALSIAWAQITEGDATCGHCGEPATVVLATGADPDYVPLCWEAAALMISASLDLGAQLFRKKE